MWHDEVQQKYMETRETGRYDMTIPEYKNQEKQKVVSLDIRVENQLKRECDGEYWNYFTDISEKFILD